MKTPTEQQNGIVAILDALGAASYSDAEVERFMQSRENVLRILNEKIEVIHGSIESGRITTFTFNDTILLVLKCETHEPNLYDIVSFSLLIGKFLVDSMQHGILFRGSISIGSFYMNESANTVMGQAVTDAAAWYDKADWIGIHATPHATIVIQQWIEYSTKKMDKPIHEKFPPRIFADIVSDLMIDYDVPLNDVKTVRVKAVNWPKFNFSPEEEPKGKLLKFLAMHRIPRGTESKYYNTITFIDQAVKEEKKKKSSSA